MRFNSIKSLLSLIVCMEGVGNLRPLSTHEEIVARIKKYPKYISHYKCTIEYIEPLDYVSIIVEDPNVFATQRLVDEITLFRDKENGK